MCAVSYILFVSYFLAVRYILVVCYTRFFYNLLYPFLCPLCKLAKPLRADDQKVWWDANQKYSAPEIVDDIVPCSERTLSANIRRSTRPTWNSIQQEIDRRISIPAEVLPIEPTPTEIADIINPSESNTPIPLYTAEESVTMAGYGNEMGMFQLIKPEPFSGERGSANVDDFLDTLELTFPYLERQVINPDRRERAKVLTLQGHLEGKAKASNRLEAGQ